MLNVLIVSYTPRFDSNTLRLVETSMSALSTKTSIICVDLVETPPPFLESVNLNALLKRNFMGLPLTDVEQAAVRGADHFLDQVLKADRVIVAFPMYNFSVPAAVKAWIDTIIQKDRTFGIDASGQYHPLCRNKRALILMTSGNDFGEPTMQPMNHASTLMEHCLNFIGIGSHTITAYGLNQYADRAEQIVVQAQEHISQYLSADGDWLEQARND